MFESKCGSSISIAFAAWLLVSLLSSSFCFDATIRDQKILLLAVLVASAELKSHLRVRFKMHGEMLSVRAVNNLDVR